MLLAFARLGFVSLQQQPNAVLPNSHINSIKNPTDQGRTTDNSQEKGAETASLLHCGNNGQRIMKQLVL
jgi:hypothetical protein